MKVFTRTELIDKVYELKAAGKVIVLTNGCFDILHAGHVRYLGEAKKKGDILIVGLNSDQSVSSLKGPTRPVNPEEDRAEVLAALAAVDYVVVFGERTAEELVAAVKPDVYVKGGDYQVEDLPETPVVRAYGGKIVLVPEVPGRSSSNVIGKISGQK